VPTGQYCPPSIGMVAAFKLESLAGIVGIRMMVSNDRPSPSSVAFLPVKVCQRSTATSTKRGAISSWTLPSAVPEFEGAPDNDWADGWAARKSIIGGLAALLVVLRS
jgi:hypothetical protein